MQKRPDVAACAHVPGLRWMHGSCSFRVNQNVATGVINNRVLPTVHDLTRIISDHDRLILDMIQYRKSTRPCDHLRSYRVKKKHDYLDLSSSG